MAKNPVFPLYYNDILGSCRTWSDEEFGAYMRLLIEQWDKGTLPNDYQRLTRIATSLDTNWGMLKKKFAETDVGLQNLNLESIRDKLLKHKEKQKENIRKRYQKTTTSITKTLPLEDENEIYVLISSILPESTKEEIMLIIEMMKIWDAAMPNYVHEQTTDYHACLNIAYKIAEMEKWKKAEVIAEYENDCLMKWAGYVKFISGHKWFSGLTLDSISTPKNWQKVLNEIKNPAANGLKIVQVNGLEEARAEYLKKMQK